MSFSITKTQGYGKRRLRDVRIAATVPVHLFLTQGVVTIRYFIIILKTSDMFYHFYVIIQDVQ